MYEVYGLDEDDIRMIKGHLSCAAVGSVDADEVQAL